MSRPEPRSHPLWPRPLPADGVIGLCSPAGPSGPDAIDRAEDALRRRGFDVVVAPHARARHPDRDYLAGTDDQRAADLNALLADPAVDLVLCARGGYGAGRIVDRIDVDAVRRDPKPLVGYSDITALNLALLARAGVVSFSGIMATAGDGFGEETLHPFSEASFFEAVCGGPPMILAQPDDAPLRVLRPPADGGSRVRGPLVPVCLTLLESLASTPFVPDLTGAILVVEDVHEDLYAVDRALNQLRLSGVLDALSALLLGSFTGTDAQNAALRAGVPRLALEMTPAHVPVAAGVAYGHIPRRLTLPVGADAVVDLSAGTFAFGV